MLDFKQQLQYAYLNERPRLFEDLIDKTIEEIDKYIINLTQRNIFEVIIAMNRRGYSGDLDSILESAYKDDLEEREITAFYVSQEDEEMLGFSDRDLMEAIYDYYEDRGCHLRSKDNMKHIHFMMNWEDIVKERQEPFTEADLLFDSLENELKRNNNDYNIYMDEVKTKVKSDIIKDIVGRKYQRAKLIFELRQYSGNGTNTPAPEYEEGECVYHIKADRLCEYPFDSFVIDISHYLQDIGFEVSCMKLHDMDRVYSIYVDWSNLVSKIIN